MKSKAVQAEHAGDGRAAPSAPPMVTTEQLDRLGSAWADARRVVEHAKASAPQCARLAELAVATAAVARRLHRARTAEQVIGQTLAALKAACAAHPGDLARHLAFARVLESAAWHEQTDPRASFDALRAAAAVLNAFAPAMEQDGADPLARLALSTGLLRPLSTAARMLDDAPLRRQIWERCWNAALRWADVSKRGPDHAHAVEWVVLLAFELAVDELDSSAGACLERCEDLREHLDALEAVRAGDAVCLLHRSAFHRLWSDAWHRLGDPGEALRALEECEGVLRKLDSARDGDSAAISTQRAALARDREKLAAGHQRRRATGP